MAKTHGSTAKSGVSKLLAIPQAAVIETWATENAEDQIVYSTLEHDQELRGNQHFLRFDPDEADATRGYYTFRRPVTE